MVRHSQFGQAAISLAASSRPMNCCRAESIVAWPSHVGKGAAADQLMLDHRPKYRLGELQPLPDGHRRQPLADHVHLVVVGIAGRNRPQ